MTDEPSSLKTAQAHLDATRAHASIAEKQYAAIWKEYQHLQSGNPALSQNEALQQSIANLYGDKAADVTAQIVLDSDRARIFAAGEEFAQAQKALKEGGFGTINNRLQKGRTLLRDLKETRNSFAHPEQEFNALTDDEFPKAAETAQKYTQQELDTLRSMHATAGTDTARETAIEHLERMQSELSHFQKPGGYRLSLPSELTLEDLTKATELQEIYAGSHAAEMKVKLKNAGHKLDSKVFPGDGEPIDVIPGNKPGEHPVDALHVRRNDLAHLDPKPEHPGAIERAGAGNYISDQLPSTIPELGTHPEHVTLVNGQSPAVTIDAVSAHLHPPGNMNEPAMQPQLQQPAQFRHMPTADTLATQTAQHANIPTQGNSSTTAQTGVEAQPLPNPKTLPPPQPVITPETGNIPHATAEAGAAAGMAGKIAKIGGPALLGAGTLWSAGVEGYQAYEQGKTAAVVALATGKGALTGAIDTIAPGARNGYSDVTGAKGKELSALDRMLNGASDATQSVATVASGVTLAGVESGPLDIAPATVAAGAFVANIGVNLIKAGVKATGYSGKDQDGGYIYDVAVKGADMMETGFEKIHHFFTGAPAAQISEAPHTVKPQPAAAPQEHPKANNVHY